MDELRICFDNGDSICYKYGNLELKDKRNFGYCSYDKIENYILLYWEKREDKCIIVIGNTHMKTPKKYTLTSDSKYREDFEKLYKMMCEQSKCSIQHTLKEAMRYKISYKPIITERSKPESENKQVVMNQTDSNQARCPRCGSTSLSANKRGFGMGKAVVGTLAFGVIGGVLAGSIGAKKIEVTCLKCGKKFKV